MLCGTLHAQTPISVGQKYSIHSEVFDEKREIWIGLPKYYDAEKSYPTIYIMDAEGSLTSPWLWPKNWLQQARPRST